MIASEPLYCCHCKGQFPVVGNGSAAFYVRHVIACCESHIARLHQLGLVSLPDDTYPARPNLLRGFSMREIA